MTCGKSATQQMAEEIVKISQKLYVEEEAMRFSFSTQSNFEAVYIQKVKTNTGKYWVLGFFGKDDIIMIPEVELGIVAKTFYLNMKYDYNMTKRFQYENYVVTFNGAIVWDCDCNEQGKALQHKLVELMNLISDPPIAVN